MTRAQYKIEICEKVSVNDENAVSFIVYSPNPDFWLMVLNLVIYV